VGATSPSALPPRTNTFFRQAKTLDLSNLQAKFEAVAPRLVTVDFSDATFIASLLSALYAVTGPGTVDSVSLASNGRLRLRLLTNGFDTQNNRIKGLAGLYPKLKLIHLFENNQLPAPTELFYLAAFKELVSVPSADQLLSPAGATTLAQLLAPECCADPHSNPNAVAAYFKLHAPAVAELAACPLMDIRNPEHAQYLHAFEKRGMQVALEARFPPITSAGYSFCSSDIRHFVRHVFHNKGWSVPLPSLRLNALTRVYLPFMTGPATYINFGVRISTFPDALAPGARAGTQPENSLAAFQSQAQAATWQRYGELAAQKTPVVADVALAMITALPPIRFQDISMDVQLESTLPTAPGQPGRRAIVLITGNAMEYPLENAAGNSTNPGRRVQRGFTRCLRIVESDETAPFRPRLDGQSTPSAKAVIAGGEPRLFLVENDSICFYRSTFAAQPSIPRAFASSGGGHRHGPSQSRSAPPAAASSAFGAAAAPTPLPVQPHEVAALQQFLLHYPTVPHDQVLAALRETGLVLANACALLQQRGLLPT
jgi:hypothetical protein